MFGMDSFEFNKIAGALLGTLLFAMGLGILAEAVFHTPRPVPGPPPALTEIPEGVRETEVPLPADIVRSLAGTAAGGSGDVAVCEVRFTYQGGLHGLQLYMCALRFFA